MASTYLSWTPSNTGTRTTFTWSFWVKRNALGSYQKIHDADYNNDANYYCSLFFKNDDTLVMSNIDAGSTNINWATTRKFKDITAWYHIVVTFDTTNGTANDRIRCYVNGERETLTGTFAVAQGTDNTFWNRSGNKNWIGAKSVSVSDYLDANLSHFYFIDGTAYDASAFGSTDATTGEWKINTSPSVTMGTNGFLILKDGITVTDQSSNSNNWTVAGGTLTKTEDCPSNIFATLNALDNHYASSTFSYGNNNVVFNNTNECFNYSTLGMSSGKFYFEGKQISYGSASERNYFGVTHSPPDASTDWLGNNNYSWGYRSDGKVYNSGQLQGTYSSFANGDIIGVALDVTNSKVYFSKNGVWQNSADPAAGSNGLSVNANKTYFFAVGETTGGSGVESATNFGNGYFKTTAVSSAGTNASGNGIFEYDVPTGFTALSTKGLNT
jgi:hypothetical protein